MAHPLAGWPWRKGPAPPTEIDARLGAVRLEPIPRLTALERYQLKPLPASLEAVRGVHPRLHLNDRRIADLRAAIKGSHAAIWNKVRAQADRAVRRGPPSYIKNDGHSGDEQLWQREVGNTLPLLAMAYVLSGEKAYLDAARHWSLASCGYPTWGLGRIDGMDLAAGHQLYGLALVYDWCYHDLDDAARRAIRRTLVERASAMYQAAATGAVWWRRSYLQNHLWVDTTGLAAAGFALFDEVDEASGWIGLPLEAPPTFDGRARARWRQPRGRRLLGIRGRVPAQVHGAVANAAGNGPLPARLVAEHGSLRPLPDACPGTPGPAPTASWTWPTARAVTGTAPTISSGDWRT